MNPQYSIWLLPAAQHEQRLTDTIAELSEVQGESRFAPHVTIQGDLCVSEEALAALVARLATEITVQRWEIQGIECSAHFFRCLYLRFVPNPAFARLQAQATAFSGTTDGLSPYPHLSLAYGEATAATRARRDALAGTLANGEVVFDRIALVHSSKDVPIADWQILARHRLATNPGMP